MSEYKACFLGEKKEKRKLCLNYQFYTFGLVLFSVALTTIFFFGCSMSMASSLTGWLGEVWEERHSLLG